MADWVEEGKAAPAFTLASDAGTKIKLADLKGAPVVLYFYPKDDTPGCTKEACAPSKKTPRMECSHPGCECFATARLYLARRIT